MKLPRWLVIAMLTSSVLSMFATAGLWWVTWPERTAREFILQMSKAPKDCSWIQLMSKQSDVATLNSFFEFLSFQSVDADINPQPRSRFDILAGRQ